jgi:predicted kinase
VNLYLIRGLPGSGKSTFAEMLAANLLGRHYEADMFHYNEEGVYDWKPERVAKAHNWCQDKVRQNMEDLFMDIVVSNTFTTEKELKPYLELAAKHGYKVTTLVVENRHGNSSIHGVPEDTMAKMKNRFSVKL